MIGGLAREAAKRLTATCEGQDLGGGKAPLAPPVLPPLEIMLLLKWIKVEKFVLPSSSTCAYSSLSKKDLDNAKLNMLLKLERTGKSCFVMLCTGARGW